MPKPRSRHPSLLLRTATALSPTRLATGSHLQERSGTLTPSGTRINRHACCACLSRLPSVCGAFIPPSPFPGNPAFIAGFGAPNRNPRSSALRHPSTRLHPDCLAASLYAVEPALPAPRFSDTKLACGTRCMRVATACAVCTTILPPSSYSPSETREPYCPFPKNYARRRESR